MLDLLLVLSPIAAVVAVAVVVVRRERRPEPAPARGPLEDPVVRRHVGVLTDPRRPTTAPTRALFDVLAQLSAVPATLPPGAAWVT